MLQKLSRAYCQRLWCADHVRGVCTSGSPPSGAPESHSIMTTDNSPAYPQDENIFIPFSSWVHQNTLPSVVGEEHMRRPCTATGAGALFSQRGVTHPWRRYNTPTGAYRASPVSWSMCSRATTGTLCATIPIPGGGAALCMTRACSRARPRRTRIWFAPTPAGERALRHLLARHGIHLR